mgnify:CR=1 FL=1
MAIRLPLWDPGRFLDRHAAVCRLLWSRGAGLLWLAETDTLLLDDGEQLEPGMTFNIAADVAVPSPDVLRATRATGAGARGDLLSLGSFTRLLSPKPGLAVKATYEGLPGKPEPAIFLEASKRIGALAANCIVFEDAPLGIEAARRAGMRAVAVCTGHTAAELDGPHVMAHIRNYHELLNTDFLETLHAATA